jgi:hypothetical protein
LSYKEAIKRPFTDSKKLIIGSLLNIIPIINFFVLGYILEAAEETLTGKKALPEWADWGHLFKRGLVGVGISLVWAIPLFIVLVFGGGIALLTALATQNTAALTNAGAIVGIVFIVGLVTYYIIPLALLNYVEESHFGSAFALKTLLKKGFTKKYVVAWIVSVLIGIVLTSTAGLIPFASFVLQPAASFISAIITFTIIGEIFHDI